jgi:hypothetical protein
MAHHHGFEYVLFAHKIHCTLISYGLVQALFLFPKVSQRENTPHVYTARKFYICRYVNKMSQNLLKEVTLQSLQWDRPLQKAQNFKYTPIGHPSKYNPRTTLLRFSAPHKFLYLMSRRVVKLLAMVIGTDLLYNYESNYLGFSKSPFRILGHSHNFE